jgi:hypothetical protein
LPELGSVFSGFSLRAYAQVSANHIQQRIVPWFLSRRAGSLTLRRSLVGLANTARILCEWSANHGNAVSSLKDAPSFL